jgi:hypothetical protein
VYVQLDGTIVAPSDPDKWPANSKHNWLLFYQAHGMSLKGAGLIDGKGQKWWELPCKSQKGHGGSSGHGAACDSPVVSGLTNDFNRITTATRACRRQPMQVLLVRLRPAD